MAGLVEYLPDVILSSLYIYLLIRLIGAREDHFKTPFFIFFIATGIYSIIAVITYQFIAQFRYYENYWTVVFHNPAYAINSFGAVGATLGKAFIAIHRYFVLRTRDFSEKKWTRTLIIGLLAVQFVVPLILTTPVWPASHIFRNGNITEQIIGLAPVNTLIMKGISVCTYSLYIICNGIFTFLTSRELARLRRMLQENTSTTRAIIVQQRNMFIIVTVCSVSHLVKALQQFTIAVATYFHFDELYAFIWPWYPLVNGMATYAAPLFLVLLSPNVREQLVFSRKNPLTSTTSSSSIRMLFVLVSIALGLGAWFVYKRQQRAARVAHLSGKIAQRKNEQAELLEWARQEAEKVPEERRKEIGAMDFKQLLAALQSGEVTSLEAVTTYIGLSLVAHEKTNCVTMYIKESVKQARALDGHRKDGKQLPPLFGLPVSIKESIGVSGTDKTWGYAGSIHFPSTRDAPTVEMLKQLGAVPFVKTNVPLSLLSYTCGNEIYGWTENPHKAGRTPGGSTGGEAALIAAGGSLLGIGSDVGGSIRMPAHYAGIAGVKPSSARLSLLRIDEGYKGPKRGGGYPLIEANEGPMAASIETCAEILKQFWSSSIVSDGDPYKPPVGWNAEKFEEGKKYRIGYYTMDGWFEPTPGCARVVEEAKEILLKQGHTLVPFSPPDVPEMFRVYISALTVDGGVSLMGSIEEDLPPPIFLSALRPLRVPIFVQRSMSFVAGLLGYWRLAKFMRSMTKSSVELRQDYASIQLYRAKFVEEMRKANVDMLLCPVNVMPAPPHEAPLHLSAGCSYTALYNLLDFGAGVCRVGTWNKEDEKKLENYPESDPWYKMAKNFSKDSVGLPLGVQLTAPPFREEAVLRVLIDLERNVKKL